MEREPDDNAPEEDEAPDVDGLAELADVMNDLVIRHAPKRVQFSVPLRFGGRDGDIEIGISGYVNDHNGVKLLDAHSWQTGTP